MAIYSGSRYEYSTVGYLSGDPYGVESTQPILFYYFDEIGTITYKEYEWKLGDRLDVLAFQMYRNPSLWWVIAEHNPEAVDPANIPAGTVLRIPNV